MEQTDLECLGNKLNNIDHITIRKRLNRELSTLIESRFCTIDDIEIEKEEGSDNLYHYKVAIYNTNKGDYYEIYLSNQYPFNPPKVTINFKPYINYLKIYNFEFQSALSKYLHKNCYCCSTILCNGNWAPCMNLNTIFNEVEQFKKECRFIAYAIITQVIKRKYLVFDINILEWVSR